MALACVRTSGSSLAIAARSSGSTAFLAQCDQRTAEAELQVAVTPPQLRGQLRRQHRFLILRHQHHRGTPCTARHFVIRIAQQ